MTNQQFSTNMALITRIAEMVYAMPIEEMIEIFKDAELSQTEGTLIDKMKAQRSLSKARETAEAMLELKKVRGRIRSEQSKQINAMNSNAAESFLESLSR